MTVTAAARVRVSASGQNHTNFIWPKPLLLTDDLDSLSKSVIQQQQKYPGGTRPRSTKVKIRRRKTRTELGNEFTALHACFIDKTVNIHCYFACCID